MKQPSRPEHELISTNSALQHLFGDLEKWRLLAKCGVDEMWHLFDSADAGECGGTRKRPYPDRAITAALVCADCPVIQNCGEYADLMREPGVWAGKWRRHIPKVGYTKYPIDISAYRKSVI